MENLVPFPHLPICEHVFICVTLAINQNTLAEFVLTTV
jgi:hypothetical protein